MAKSKIDQLLDLVADCKRNAKGKAWSLYHRAESLITLAARRKSATTHPKKKKKKKKSKP